MAEKTNSNVELENVRGILESGDPLTITLTKQNTLGSKAWDYFGQLYRNNEHIDKSNIYCNICLKIGKLTRYSVSSSTGNLIRHCKDDHHLDISTLNNEAKLNKISSYFASKDKTFTSVPFNSKKFVLGRQISLWFSRDLIPFNKISTNAMYDFLSFFNVVKDRTELPCASTISSTALTDTYEWVLQEVMKSLRKSPENIAITFDCWTDNYRRLSYITYTAHWIDEEFKPNYVSLGTFLFEHPHKATDISKNIKETLERFELSDKCITAVTDGGSNVVKACKLLNMQRVPCTAHSLHNLITSDLLKKTIQKDSTIANLLLKMRDVHRSLIYKQDKLRKEQIEINQEKLFNLIDQHYEIENIIAAENQVENHIPDHIYCANLSTVASNDTTFYSLKRDVPTRWNSILVMCDSFVRNKELLQRYLEKQEEYSKIINNEEIELLKEFISILSIFKLSTDILSGSTYSTLNLFLLFKMEIEDNLKNSKENDFSVEISICVETLLNKIEKRFNVIDEHICAALMDPGMMNISEIEKYLISKKLTKFDFLKNMIIKYKLSDSHKPSTTDAASLIEIGASQTNNLNELEPPWKKIRNQLLKKHVESTEVVQPLDTEINKYIQNRNTESIDDPLLWWRENYTTYPRLSKLARAILCVPATSAPSERAFSQAGMVITAKRSDIAPHKVHKTLFIHDNYEFVKRKLNSDN